MINFDEYTNENKTEHNSKYTEYLLEGVLDQEKRTYY